MTTTENQMPADYYTTDCECGFTRWGSHTQACVDATRATVAARRELDMAEANYKRRSAIGASTRQDSVTLSAAATRVHTARAALDSIENR